uniref:RING-type domain-containing protein n=1 Tax=Oreochromis niloticus TaxID=8128 RepID=A0A669BNP3_ORENI
RQESVLDPGTESQITVLMFLPRLRRTKINVKRFILKTLLQLSLRVETHTDAVFFTCIQGEQERKEFNRLLAEAARQQNNVPGQDNLQGVAMCVICLNQPCICVLLDCGHVCCCHTCYQALPQQYCPICRQRIVRVLPLYQV